LRANLPSVCTILFLLVARQLGVSEALGTILCQGILQNIVPPTDVWSNFVLLPTAPSVAGRHAAACEAVDGCRQGVPRDHGAKSGPRGRGERRLPPCSGPRSRARRPGPWGQEQSYAISGNKIMQTNDWRFRLLHKQSLFDITPGPRFLLWTGMLCLIEWPACCGRSQLPSPPSAR